jgi:hypothetical protein
MRFERHPLWQAQSMSRAQRRMQKQHTNAWKHSLRRVSGGETDWQRKIFETDRARSRRKPDTAAETAETRAKTVGPIRICCRDFLHRHVVTMWAAMLQSSQEMSIDTCRKLKVRVRREMRKCKHEPL